MEPVASTQCTPVIQICIRELCHYWFGQWLVDYNDLSRWRDMIYSRDDVWVKLSHLNVFDGSVFNVSIISFTNHWLMVQDCSIPIANALEILQSYTKPSKYPPQAIVCKLTTMLVRVRCVNPMLLQLIWRTIFFQVMVWNQQTKMFKYTSQWRQTVL